MFDAPRLYVTPTGKPGSTLSRNVRCALPSCRRIIDSGGRAVERDGKVFCSIAHEIMSLLSRC
jgi:hypothetical protein